MELDHYLYFKSLGAVGWISSFAGGAKRTFEAGKALLDYGQKHSNVRSMVMGHCNIAWGYFIMGDYPSAIKSAKQAVQVSSDIFYYNFSKAWLGTAQLMNGQVEEAEKTLQEVYKYSKEHGAGVFALAAYANLGLISIMKGQFSQGEKMIEESIRESTKMKPFRAMFHCAMGGVYLQLLQRPEPVSASTIARNIGFLIRNIPSARKKAEYHFNRAIEVAKEIGAKAILGRAYLYLGLLHKAKGKSDQALEYISRAVKILEECEAEVHLKQAKETLASLG